MKDGPLIEIQNQSISDNKTNATTTMGNGSSSDGGAVDGQGEDIDQNASGFILSDGFQGECIYMYDCAYDCVAKDGTIWLARMEQKHVVMLPKQ